MYTVLLRILCWSISKREIIRADWQGITENKSMSCLHVKLTRNHDLKIKPIFFLFALIRCCSNCNAFRVQCSILLSTEIIKSKFPSTNLWCLRADNRIRKIIIQKPSNKTYSCTLWHRKSTLYNQSIRSYDIEQSIVFVALFLISDIYLKIQSKRYRVIADSWLKP